MPSQKYVISLVMQRHNLPPIQLRLWREQGPEEVSCEKTEGSAEVVEYELGHVVCGVTVSGHLLALHPVADGEVEGGPLGEVYDRQSGRAFLVFFQDEEGSVVSVRGEGGDLADRELVAVTVSRTADIDAVREEGGKEVGFVV